MIFRQLCAVLCFSVLFSGCSRNDSEFKLPGVYRINIQQGNVIEQENLDRLKPGMDKDQVLYIMGTPAVQDPFHTDRWDYIYTFTRSAERRQQQHVTLIFDEEDKLIRVEGDIVAGKRKAEEDIVRETKTVDVPARKVKTRAGIFSWITDAIPFVGDKDEVPPPPKSIEQSENTSEESEE